MEDGSNSASSARDPLVGKTLQQRYRVLERIGRGGMGVVYLAEHVLLRRKVAIKTLHTAAFGSDELAARFQREAMAAAAVGNEHIALAMDMGQLDDGSLYLVIEYLEGVDLAWAVATEGPLAVSRTLHIVSQLCDALSAVHAAGIVHRDLKPENLFLIERFGVRDFVKVLDFGVCRFAGPTASSARRLTETGAALGTPQFMAPEQIEGLPEVGPGADLYAVGGILFYALTGACPFEAPSLPRLFMRICDEPPPPLERLRPDVPQGLAAVVARALQKRPEDRFASSAELKAALAPFREDAAMAATQPVRAPVRSTAAQPHFEDEKPLEAPPPLEPNPPGAHERVGGTALSDAWRRRWPARIAVSLSVAVGAWVAWQMAASSWTVQRPGAPEPTRAGEPASPAAERRAAPGSSAAALELVPVKVRAAQPADGSGPAQGARRPRATARTDARNRSGHAAAPPAGGLHGSPAAVAPAAPSSPAMQVAVSDAQAGATPDGASSPSPANAPAAKDASTTDAAIDRPLRPRELKHVF